MDLNIDLNIDFYSKEKIENKPSELIRLEPNKLYTKYVNINCCKYTNSNDGILFKCLEPYNFDYRLINKLLYNLDNKTLTNLYRYIWIQYKLLKTTITEEHYIAGFEILHFNKYNEEEHLNYYNFVYNNLHTDNEVLSIVFYNMICKYLI